MWKAHLRSGSTLAIQFDEIAKDVETGNISLVFSYHHVNRDATDFQQPNGNAWCNMETLSVVWVAEKTILNLPAR